ncbi:MFS transporter [Arthrobacter sp. Helios]|uniref:CynX/NimT family MFS transporter n=1 Tax=Arthrobacter sp. Helios TaxID=2828862 RepID=UPI00205B00EF|nr:MFS transporter [Arthrobacter sp. Helios]UPO76270.1 MFS transporter [Arthrobacter sp. Helios]
MAVSGRIRTNQPVRAGLALTGVLLIGINLRVAFVSVGPLLADIGRELEFTSAQAGFLTGLPLIAFALFSPLAPAFAARVGLDRALWLSLALLASGTAFRSAPLPAALWIGTILIGVAIAFLNVLLPSLIKRDFPDRVSQLTGIYIAAHSAVAALGAAVVVPISLAQGTGWRLALGIWGGLALIAMAVLLPTLKGSNAQADGTERAPKIRYRSPWTTLLGWQVTLFMGLQSLAFYILMTWLPSIEHEQGISETTAGLHVSVFLLVGMVASLLTGGLLHRFRDQRPVAVFGSLLATAGFLGLLLAPGVPLLWVVVSAAGAGSLIVTALSLFSLRTTNHVQAASLSGMAQSVGYGIGAAGPVVFGFLYDLSGNWTVPLAASAGAMALCCGMALLAGRNRFLPEGPREASA